MVIGDTLMLGAILYFSWKFGQPIIARKEKLKRGVKIMDNPCRYCIEYPIECRGLCIDKMKYINETDREISTIHRNEKPIKVVKAKDKIKTKVQTKVKVKPVIVDTNKNGIRRERVSR